VLPAVRFLDADAEDADDRFAAHGGAELFAVLSVRPRRRQAATGLPVGDQDGCQLADAPHVERAGRPAAGVRDYAGVGMDLADLPIPETPQLETPRLPPEDVGPPGRVLRVGRARQLVSEGFTEVRLTVRTVTHPRAVPAVDEDAVDLVAGHDF